ncbi:MAG: DUF58 domain-containing protein [Ruminococcus sp.]|nr:DUF58 domain-containing protein [Ruminococcus sp.]
MLFLYLIILITSGFFYILYEPRFSFLLFAFLLILPAVLFVMTLITARLTRVSFSSAVSSAGRGSKLPLTLKIVNRSIFIVPNMLIELEMKTALDDKKSIVRINTPVSMLDTQYLTLQISGMHYGNIQIGIKRARVCDMLRLFKLRVPLGKTDSLFRRCTMMILPDGIPMENNISNYSELGLETDEYSKTSKGDDPSEIFDIHEYQDGDKISRIHWKLSAKQNKTMVKDYSLPITNSIMIAADLALDRSRGDYLSQYDTMIETVSALSFHLTEHEIPHKVIWFDSVKNSVVKMNITDDESDGVLISSLLRAPVYQEKNRLLECFLKDPESSRMGHFIYISAFYDEGVRDMLSESELAIRYSYLPVSAQMFVPYDTGDGVSLMPLVPGRVAQSLQDMIL